MNARQKYSLFVLILMFGLATLACGLVSSITDPVGEVIDEAQQIVTQVGEIAY